MTPEFAKKLETAVGEMDLWKGDILLIEESLSRARHLPLAHDRHFATLSRFTLRLEHVGWAISGSAITLDGKSDEHPSFYQVTTDRVVSVEKADPSQITFIEHFEQQTERRSIIRQLKGVEAGDPSHTACPE